MYIGHYAVGFASKKVASRVSRGGPAKRFFRVILMGPVPDMFTTLNIP